MKRTGIAGDSMASNPYPALRRGLSIGGVLTRAFGAIGSAPLAFFGVSAVLIGGPSLFFRLTVGGMFTPGSVALLATHWPLLVVGGIGWWLIYLVAQTLLFLLTATAGETRRPGAGALVGATTRVLPLVFVQSILLTVAISLASVLLIVPGLLLWLLWAVAGPSLAIERTGLFASFGRSARLTAGARWPIFALLLLVFASYYVASGALGVVSLTVNGMGAAASRAGPTYVIAAVFSALLQTAFTTIWSAIKAALFLELRDWKDGPAGERLAGIFA